MSEISTLTPEQQDAAASKAQALLATEIRAERDRYKAVLERLADEDTWVLGEGFGGGPQEELHVRASLAKQALGQELCGCTECQGSLGYDLDSDGDEPDSYEDVATQGLHGSRADVDL